MITKLLTVCVTLALTGCWTLPPYSEVDFGKRTDGSTFIRDTERTRRYMDENTARTIQAELKGEKPLGGMKSWDENWHRVFTSIRKGQENPERYISFVIEARRAAGLPELKPQENEK